MLVRCMTVREHEVNVNVMEHAVSLIDSKWMANVQKKLCVIGVYRRVILPARENHVVPEL